MNKRFLYPLTVFLFMYINQQVLAIDYALPDTNGQIQHMDQYKGKWIIVNYWATWCSTCMKEIPNLIDFYENNKEQLKPLRSSGV